jgi:polysaccharide pyruvyl transferase WcaK-like protein
MRIIVDTGLNSGSAEYQNMGDVAMLQVAVARLLSLWPSATVEVLTESLSDLERYCPGATPLSRLGRDTWVGSRVLLGRFHRFLPTSVSVRLSAWKRVLTVWWPSLLKWMIHLRLGLRDGHGRKEAMQMFFDAMDQADLFVVCGSGGFADSCRTWNLSILGTVEAALQRGMTVALFGQGMGPLNDLDVISWAKHVLPRVNLISLRGGRGGPGLLEFLQVPQSKFLTTGDEAIDLSYEARAEQPGDAIGINLRVAAYAGVNSRKIEQVGAVVREFARGRGVSILPIPIAFHEWANDQQTIREMLAGFDDGSDGGVSLDTPLKVVKQVSQCRLVVTGAYHAAVFALAQGIPVVCLSNSTYYSAKFQGLEDLFGCGCETVMLSDQNVSNNLSLAMEGMWRSAATVRRPLQEAAVRQIELSRSAYKQIQNLFESAGNAHPML